MKEKVEITKEIEVAKYLLEEIGKISDIVPNKYQCGSPGYSKTTIIEDAKTIRRLMNEIIKKYTPVY